LSTVGYCRQWDLNPRQYTLTRTHNIKLLNLSLAP